jgi:hypothetical protein
LYNLEKLRVKRGSGEVVKTTLHSGGRGQKHFFPPALKAPRQCPLVLLVEIRLRKGKALGREEGKGLGSGLGMSRGEKLSRGFAAYDRNSFCYERWKGCIFI